MKENLRKGGSLSEPSSLSLGMFGKREWRSVLQAGRCRLDEIRSVRVCSCLRVLGVHLPPPCVSSKGLQIAANL